MAYIRDPTTRQVPMMISHRLQSKALRKRKRELLEGLVGTRMR